MPVHHSFLADFMAWILILFNNSHASIAHSKNFSSWHFTMTGYPIRLNKGKTTIQGLGYFFWGGGVSTLWKKRWPRRLWEKLVIIPLWPRSGMPPRSAQRRARVCRRRIEKLGSLRSRRICDSLHLGNGCLPEKSQRSWRQPRLSTGCHEPFFFSENHMPVCFISHAGRRRHRLPKSPWRVEEKVRDQKEAGTCRLLQSHQTRLDIFPHWPGSLPERRWISVPRSHLVRLPRSHPDIIAIKLGFYSTVLVSVLRLHCKAALLSMKALFFLCPTMTKWWFVISCESIGKCCAKLDSSTTLLVALPCRLDKSSDNFEGSRYIVSVPRLHCKVQQKNKTEHCLFLLLTMQNGLIQWNFAKF